MDGCSKGGGGGLGWDKRVRTRGNKLDGVLITGQRKERNNDLKCLKQEL